MKSGKKRLIWIIVAALATVIGILFALFYFGVLHINSPDKDKYPVRGVDVSSYQGEIDWDTLASQEIDFAFIKATEGSSYVDPFFDKNWKNASKTDLRIGAYHFFSFESSGEKQGKLFCDTVKAVDNMLPPVIDVEFYGKFRSESDIDVHAVKTELRKLADVLYAEYGVKPLIYASSETYGAIYEGDFEDCGLWIRSVYSGVSDGINWTFWQYSNRHRLDGYDGEERYIDMNVFYGSVEDFKNYP